MHTLNVSGQTAPLLPLPVYVILIIHNHHQDSWFFFLSSRQLTLNAASSLTILWIYQILLFFIPNALSG